MDSSPLLGASDPFADRKHQSVLQWSALALLGLLVLGRLLWQLHPLEWLTKYVGVAHPASASDTQQLHWLKEADYSALERYYSPIQEQFEQGGLSDAQLYAEFRKLYQDDPDNAEYFDRWVNASPRSYSARLAQGAYYYRMAWAVRGDGFIQQTAALRLYLMQVYLYKATQILKASVALSPKPYLSTLYLLNVAMLNGTREESRQWLAAGTSLDPNASLVRIRYMITLQPRWGGSLEEMRAYVAECELEHVAPQTLAALKLNLAIEVVYVESRRAAPERRIELFSEVLSEAQAAGSGPPPMALAGLARADWDLNRHAEADQLLAQIDPSQVDDAWTLSQVAYVLVKEQRMREAWTIVQKAARLGDAWSQVAVGKTLINGCPDINLAPDRAAGLRWLRAAAQQGDAEATAYLRGQQG